MATAFIKTFGCTANLHDSEVMAGLLKRAGYKIVDSSEKAKLIIINICTVKGEQKALNEIQSVSGTAKKKIVIAGCIPKDFVFAINKILPHASIVGTHKIKEIVSVVNDLEKNKNIVLTDLEKSMKINVPKVRKRDIIGIVPVLSGCSGKCTYCSVKLIKGELFSYPENKVIDEVNDCVKEGCKEIWITSQDNSCYGIEHSKKTKLPGLLRNVCSVKGDFKVRVGMMNPNNVFPVLDELIDGYKNEKIFKFLHIPVQSGNDEILKKMGRQYSVRDFKKIVSAFRKQIPEITISTDVICGFPGETKQQFMDSVALIEDVKPDVLNISRFQARPGTDAAKMIGQLHGNETKKRSQLLTEVFDRISLERNKQWIGWAGKMLVDEPGKKGTKTFVGRNYCYKPVVVKGTFKLGQEVDVKIVSAEKNYLKAEKSI